MRKIILFIICLYLGGLIVSGAIDKVEENTFKLISDNFIHNGQLPIEQVLNMPDTKGGNISKLNLFVIYWLKIQNCQHILFTPLASVASANWWPKIRADLTN